MSLSTLFNDISVLGVLLLGVFLSRRFCRDEWFEKICMAFGMATGAVPTGLALVRCVDPDMESSAPDAQGVAATLFTPVFAVMPAVAPILALQSQRMLIVIGLLITVVPLICGFLLVKRKNGVLVLKGN